MKKKYNLSILTFAITIFLTSVASFTLQNFWGQSSLTGFYRFDIIIFVIAGIALMIQWHGFEKFVSILLLFYSSINFINFALNSYEVNDSLFSVLLTLFQVLAHTLLIISTLFVSVNNSTNKFGYKATKKFVVAFLFFAFAFLIAAAIISIPNNANQIIKVSTLLASLIALYSVLYLIVLEEKVQKTHSSVNQNNTLYNEINDLFNRGIITKDEYLKRKEKIDFMEENKK